MALLSVAAASIVAAGVLAAWPRWHGGGRDREDAQLLQAGTAHVEIVAEMESRIKAFCGDCRAVPRPESFHRDAWHDEVEKGYTFYVRSARTDLTPPPMGSTIAYFRSRAPEQLAYPEPKEAPTAFRASFAVEKFDLDLNAPSPPAVAGLRWTKLRPEMSPVLLASDLMSGEVKALDLEDPQRKVRRLAQLDNPCHMELCDLDGDGDGDQDILVVSFLPATLKPKTAAVQQFPSIILLEQTSPGHFVRHTLERGFACHAAAAVGDFNHDGRLDFAVGTLSAGGGANDLGRDMRNLILGRFGERLISATQAGRCFPLRSFRATPVPVEKAENPTRSCCI